LVVAEWLIGKGVNQERIDVIVFGEQNPAEPNALPDGSPNEAGRAANRRVEVLIVPPVPADAEKADEDPESESSAAVSD
ncbi:MAG: OmpA family protein, partial [Pseudomonadota bacterium]